MDGQTWMRNSKDERRDKEEQLGIRRETHWSGPLDGLPSPKPFFSRILKITPLFHCDASCVGRAKWFSRLEKNDVRMRYVATKINNDLTRNLAFIQGQITGLTLGQQLSCTLEKNVGLRF